MKRRGPGLDIARLVGGWLSDYLGATSHVHSTAAPVDLGKLSACLQPCDVLLVEGQTRVSVAIKYLTQSTWSHASLYVGPDCGLTDRSGSPASFIEADIREGVRAVSELEYAGHHCRVCRPFGLTQTDKEAVIAFARARIGHQYDLRNVFDLARYLLPTPPVPVKWRRRLLALGSGDPTRAICSTLIAQAFQSVRFPILPTIESLPSSDPLCPGCVDELLHVRHHSLFVPRDFDVSPYFEIVKPSISHGFNYLALRWSGPEFDKTP